MGNWKFEVQYLAADMVRRSIVAQLDCFLLLALSRIICFATLV